MASDREVLLRPSIGAVRTGCLCCPPKPETAPMDWQPHPGFGMLDLTCDGETPEWWTEYASIVDWVYELGAGWTTLTRHDGTKVEYFEGDWWPLWVHEGVTLGEIEECAAEDPDHDWRLHIHGPMGGVVYQRQGCSQWVAVERLEGFA